MRSGQGSLRGAVALAGVAALAAGAVACGGSDSSSSSSGGSSGGANKASAPGITATTVTVGGHFPLTGPAAPGYSEIPQAIDAYFKYINANGGVNGRKLKFIARDDGYNPTNTVKVTKQLVLQDKVFAVVGGLGTPTHTKVVDFLNASRVPDLFVSSGCRCWDQPDQHPYTFGWQPDYVVEGKILGDYVKKNLAGKKVAYFYQDDDFGKDGVAGLDTYLKADVVSRQKYQPGNTDIGPQMAAIKQSGAQVVAMFTIPAYTALAHLAAVKLGMKAQFVVSNVGSDPTTVGGLLKAFSKGKAGASLIDGMISNGYLPPLEASSDDSWATLFRKVHDQYIPKLPLDGNVNYGMALAYTFATALQAAGQNPTRQGMVDAVEKGGLKGPVLVPYRYSAKSHAGATGVQMAKISGGHIVLSGDPQTTDDGSGPIQPYSGGHPEAPANGVPPKE
jgi:ABC-type branched-subunit amino acid transport system substrate-binding protein